MFPGCLEYCNAERTLSEYSRNIAYRLGYYLRSFLHSLTFELDVTITKAYDFSESVRVYPAGTRYPEVSAECSPQRCNVRDIQGTLREHFKGKYFLKSS